MPLRIVGSKKVPATPGLKIYDARTGDEVDDIVQVDLTLAATPAWIVAIVTVLERNEEGQKFIRDGTLAKKTESVDLAGIDITTMSSRQGTANEILHEEPKFSPERTA
jgi:hypothetical protein